MTTINAKIAIVDCSSSKVADISRILAELGAEPYLIRPPQLPGIANDPPDAFIISGNPALICDTGTNFLVDFEALRVLDIPVLGICFGHQVIGLLYGAEVSTGKEDRSQRQVELLQPDPLFNGLAKMETFQQDHTEEITLPQAFIHLATSSHCFNEAMKHQKKPIWGVQFHPESSGSTGRQVIGNFLKTLNCFTAKCQ